MVDDTRLMSLFRFQHVVNLAAAFFLVGCGGSSDTPSTPTVVTRPVALSNLQARHLGLTKDVCGGLWGSYFATDEMTVDFTGSLGSLGSSAPLLIDSDTRIILGTLSRSECSQGSPDPCQVGGALGCVLPSRRSLRFYMTVPWKPEKTWRLLVQTGAGDSNTVSARVVRPIDLPFGDGVILIKVEITRSPGPGGFGLYNVEVFTPAIAGRRVDLTMEGRRLDGSVIPGVARTFSINEPQTEHGWNPHGGGLSGFPPEPFDVRVTVEEFAAGGDRLSRDEKVVRVD